MTPPAKKPTAKSQQPKANSQQPMRQPTNPPKTTNQKPQTKHHYLRPMNIRIGYGIDYHQLVEGRDLIIGGVKIPHEKGALGHSDADVLLHAICDALLGSLALGDIGVHFPDTAQEYKDIDSKILLAKTRSLVEAEGYGIVNIDSTLCLEAPKIKPYVPQMQETIARILGLSIKDVSIKATTTEKMGFVGRQEGLVAHAVCLVRKV